MRILIDILHPHDVLVYRHFRTEMLRRGHDIEVTSRSKDVTVELLDAFDIPHRVLSDQATGTLGLGRELMSRTRKLISVARRFRPDVMTELAGPSIIPAARLLRIPAAVFYDTEFATRTNSWVYPLATTVCTPDSYYGTVRGKHITYPSYQELAYLHPNHFSANRDKLTAFGLDPYEPFSLVRFVSWQASHDTREIALTVDQQSALVDRLGQYGQVVISSEGPVPEALAGHKLQGPLHEVHHLLAFAQVVVGESATMASEAAVLGTPSVFIAKTGRGYTDDQERRYGLARTIPPTGFEEAIEAVEAAAALSPEERGQRRTQLLADKIDLTAWMVEFFETRYG